MNSTLGRFRAITAGAIFVALTAPVSAATLVHSYTFEDGTATDSAGTANGTLQGGASISGGRLHVNGVTGFMNAPLQATLTEKTLMAWVALNTTAQGGGAAISLDGNYSSPAGGGSYAHTHFDAIVFGENYGPRWQTGSESGFRNFNNGGAFESSTALVHLTITYGAGSVMTVYRNGVQYGSSGTQGSLQTFGPSNTRILLGYRHQGAGSGFLNAQIEEARVYDGVLTAGEIATIFSSGPTQVPEPASLGLTAAALGLLVAWRRQSA